MLIKYIVKRSFELVAIVSGQIEGEHKAWVCANEIGQANKRSLEDISDGGGDGNGGLCSEIKAAFAVTLFQKQKNRRSCVFSVSRTRKTKFSNNKMLWKTAYSNVRYTHCTSHQYTKLYAFKEGKNKIKTTDSSNTHRFT